MKGQVSLDLLLTILALVIFISTTTMIINEIKQNNELIILDNKLKIIANDYSSLITTSELLIDFNYEIRKNLDVVIFKGKKTIPELTTNNEKLILNISEYKRTIETNIPTNNKTIKQEEQFLVITNE
jgi:uncharacterized protein (UPF0333 family)